MGIRSLLFLNLSELGSERPGNCHKFSYTLRFGIFRIGSVLGLW